MDGCGTIQRTYSVAFSETGFMLCHTCGAGRQSLLTHAHVHQEGQATLTSPITMSHLPFVLPENQSIMDSPPSELQVSHATAAMGKEEKTTPEPEPHRARQVWRRKFI